MDFPDLVSRIFSEENVERDTLTLENVRSLCGAWQMDADCSAVFRLAVVPNSSEGAAEPQLESYSLHGFGGDR